MPDAPTGLTATAEHGQVRLAWEDPEDPAIHRYDVLRYLYDSNGVQVGATQTDQFDARQGGVRGSVPVTRRTVTGLSNGSRYGFQLRAHNSLGGGALAAEVFATPTTSVLAAPTGFRVEAVGDRFVKLKWVGIGAADHWQIRYNFAVDGNPVETGWTKIPRSSRFSNQYTVPNLTNGVAYRFWLRAVDGNGTVGSESAPVEASPVGPHARPTGLEATAGEESVTLGWDDPDDGTIERWEARIRPEGADWGDWEPIANSDSETVGTTFEGLPGGITHGFQVRAFSFGHGTGFSSAIVEATPIAVRPDQPTGLVAAAGDGGATLSWDDPGDASITAWEWRQKERTALVFGPWKRVGGAGADTTSVRVGDLTNGTSYRFEVRAVNPAGASEPSESAAIIPAPPPGRPTGLAAAGSNSVVSLSWDDPGDASITGWEVRYRVEGGEHAADGWRDIPESGAGTDRHQVTRLPGPRAQRRRKGSGFG